MKKSIEFRLATSQSDRKTLLKLLDKGKNIYNLALSHCKKQLNEVRADKEYAALLAKRRILKKEGKPTAEVDSGLQQIVRTRYRLTKTDTEKYVKDKAGYLLDGFNSQFAQVLADRALDAVRKVLYGKARKVRFKGKYDNILVSLNSKSTETGFFFDPDRKAVTYRVSSEKRISIPLVLQYRKDDGYHNFYLDQIIEDMQKHDAVDISYIRIVRRIVKGKDVFYVQFVMDTRMFGMSDAQIEAANLEISKHNAALVQRAVTAGKLTNRLRLTHFISNIVEYPQTNKIVELIRSVGLAKQFQAAFDMGPKHMAVFLKNEQYSIAVFQPIFDRLVDYGREHRVLQRRLDRQRRANNPDNYNADRTMKKRKRLVWKNSKAYYETRDRIRELHRLVRETRKTALNELSNIIVALGSSFKVEDVSYRAWQKKYGKSVGSFAPSQFIKDVYSKAESAGSETQKLPLKNALSQLCVCGVKRKKKLSERLHECECGCEAQRDVLSAYLGLFCNPDLGEWESMARQYHNADRQLLSASHRVYPRKAASRRDSGFVLCLDKRHRSCSCANGKDKASENHGGQGIVHLDSLKDLVGELALHGRCIAV